MNSFNDGGLFVGQNNIFEQINCKLNMTHDKLIFVYTAPKVGSTSLVSSFRIFGDNRYGIIHIHDEVMLEKLIGINVSINEWIEYNAQLGKEIYVIDVYRNPIERKISTYFEKIGAYHFNNSDEIVNKYDVKKIIKRFNDIFPHIANGDHYIDKYGINDEMPEIFPHEQKYLMIEKNGIKYLKLRLMDADEWGHILSNIFRHQICVVKDYQSENKVVKDLFKSFLEKYEIPENFLNDFIFSCKYLNYYYSQSEKENYFYKWNLKKCDTYIPYTLEQYKLYEDITLENCHMDKIQLQHYVDDGCFCKACVIKRNRVKQIILNGNYNGEKIYHTEAKKELLEHKLIQVKKINALNRNNLQKGINDVRIRLNIDK